MDIQALKNCLSGVMPILNNNLAEAYTEYMAGDIAAGAYGYVRSRHGTAAAVLASTEVPAEKAYQACALLAIDLRTGVASMADPIEAQAQVDTWWQCYREAGFTEVHPLFESPMQPEGAARM